MDRGEEANFDLCRETFVLFDLDIDLFFTTEVTILADQSAQATPTVHITDLSKAEVKMECCPSVDGE